MTTSTTRAVPQGPRSIPVAGEEAGMRLNEQHLHTRRITVGLGLAVVAAIHVLDLPGKFAETPYLAYAYIGLIIAAVVILERVLVVGSRIDFLAATVLSALVLVAFVINRTVGMPLATGDIGNWFEPLGLLSLVVEAFVIWQSLVALALHRPEAR